MKGTHRILLGTLAAPLALAVIAVIAFGVSSATAARTEAIFCRIEMGAPRKSVVRALGVADRERACGDNLWWGDDTQYRGKNDGRCAVEARYEYFLTTYGIGYSIEGRVVSKYRYVSE